MSIWSPGRRQFMTMTQLEKLSQYIKENFTQNQDYYLEARFACEEWNTEKKIYKKASLESYVTTEKEEHSFSSLLLFYIDQRHLKDSDIYHKAHIDRRLFSKIRSNQNYHPKKETVIALGLALELNIVEFEKLLAAASYALPKNNVFDLIIRFCITEHIYNLFDVNALLSEYQCPLIGI